MSNLITKGNSSGTGSVTLESPNTNSDFTISLPAATGTVVLGGTTPSFNGIAFPATQSASADANTLDDYEEGTWTPTVTSGSGSFTTVSATGTYVKVGKQVAIRTTITITTVGTASGDIVFTLPFTSSTSPNGDGIGAAGEFSFVGITGITFTSSSTTGSIKKYDYTGTVIGTGNTWQTTLVYFTS
jgi:hypothetical protein